MTPNFILLKLIAIVYSNNHLRARIDLSDMFTELGIYLDNVKIDKHAINTLVTATKHINETSVRYTTAKLIEDMKAVDPDFCDWDIYIPEVEPAAVEEAELQKLVMVAANELRAMLATSRIAKLMSKATFDVNHNPLAIPNMANYIREFINKLDTETSSIDSSDKAISEEIDFAVSDDVETTFSRVATMYDGGDVYKVGWKALNTALQGGPRAGEMMMLGSLEHNYKSGMTRILFRQILQYNDPPTYLAHEKKKPLALYITLEDPIEFVLQFMFQNIMFNKTGKKVDIKKFTTKEMETEVTSTLRARGWEIKMFKADPSGWTYRSLIEKIISYGAAGYDVRVVAIDYLLQIPTVGCDKSGAMGTDLRDLVRRVRNFMAAKRILCITPGQLSTQVKDILINGTPERDILNVIAERGMYAGSKQISHDLDISLLIKKVKTGQGTYLDVLLEKHRNPTAIDANLKHFALPFPDDGMPIVDDLTSKSSIHVHKIPLDY